MFNLSKLSSLYRPKCPLLVSYSIFTLFCLMANICPDSIPPALSIFQWNCRSLHTNCLKLQQHLSEESFDVLALQSLGSSRKPLPCFSDYHYPPYKKVVDNKIRVALYIKKGLSTSPTHINFLKDGIAIKIDFESALGLELTSKRLTSCIPIATRFAKVSS